MSLPDCQSSRDYDCPSSFVLKNVTMAVIDNNDTFYIIKPLDKMHYYRCFYVIGGQAGEMKSIYLIEEEKNS